MRYSAALKGVLGLFTLAFAAGILSLIAPHYALAGQSVSVPLQQEETRYFEETGFWVSGQFLEYFVAHGELEVFGYPISYPFINDYGVLVQYFQNARMEWHPANPEPYRLQLGLLGDELGYRRQSVRSTALSPRRQYFPETGHSVAYRLLDYFRKNGGIDIFGYPITEMYVENGSLVQYFQRLKLIWDLQTGQVLVGNLGEVYVTHNANRLPSQAFVVRGNPNVVAEQSRTLRVLVGLAESVADPGNEQLATVVVLDDATGKPVVGVPLGMELYDRSDENMIQWSGGFHTGDGGRVDVSIPLDGLKRGAWAVLRIDAGFGASTATHKELFLVWR